MEVVIPFVQTLMILEISVIFSPHKPCGLGTVELLSRKEGERQYEKVV
jgi:hypothetical protein